MNLEPLFIQVLPYLSHTGATEHVQGVLELSDINIGHRHFVALEGIAYDANLINTGEALLLRGTASARLDTTCDRCLEPASLVLTGEIQGYYLFDPKKTKAEDGLEEYEEVDSDGRVDLAPPILAAIVFELPTVVICTPECKGISVVSTSDTDESETAAAEDPPSPFAALKDYKFDE